jgi:nucleolar protein 14
MLHFIAHEFLFLYCRASVLNSLLHTLAGFCHIYEDISCYPEIFNPFVIVLQGLSEHRHLPLVIVEVSKKLHVQIQENVQKHEKVRQPLRMRIKKPTPIKQFNPKFEEK